MSNHSPESSISFSDSTIILLRFFWGLEEERVPFGVFLLDGVFKEKAKNSGIPYKNFAIIPIDAAVFICIGFILYKHMQMNIPFLRDSLYCCHAPRFPYLLK